MSQLPAPSRQPRRRRTSSGLLTNVLLTVCLIVGCVYAIWGTGPLKRTWIALGFGNSEPPQAGLKIRNPTGGGFQGSGDETSRPIVQPPPLPLAELDAEGLTEEMERDPFLPEIRSRPDLKIGHPEALRRTTSESELDHRFETDSHPRIDSKSNSVRTADFEEPARVNRSRPKFPKHKRIQFEVETIDTSVNQPDETGIRRINDEIEAAPVERSRAPRQRETPGKPSPQNSSSRSVERASPSFINSESIDTEAVEALIEAGRDLDAYQLLTAAYTQSRSDRPRFQQLLDTVAQRIYFTPQPQTEPPYEIVPGDQLRKIAAKYHMSWQYLSKLNQVDPKKIRPGKKLKVFQGPFNATVDLSDYELVVFLNGKFVKRYSVGVGKDNSSPIGEFTVKEKLENPVYYGPEGNVLAADDPKNPLGERWIDIGNSFGIHGTIEPDSIGKNASAGCVRMLNEDVAEVYDLLTVGSTVVIQR